MYIYFKQKQKKKPLALSYIKKSKNLIPEQIIFGTQLLKNL